MATAWWQRLPSEQRQEYERSAALGLTPLRALDNPDAGPAAIAGLDAAMASRDRSLTEAACARISDLLCVAAGAPRVRIRVAGRRPAEARGELHGLYQPAGMAGATALITLWMRTAQREDVVKTRTFLRTLLHELVHHFDMTCLALPNSYHTKGFYRRESHLLRALGDKKPTPRTSAGSPRNNTATEPTQEEGMAALRAVLSRLRQRSSTDNH